MAVTKEQQRLRQLKWNLSNKEKRRLIKQRYWRSHREDILRGDWGFDPGNWGEFVKLYPISTTLPEPGTTFVIGFVREDSDIECIDTPINTSFLPIEKTTPNFPLISGSLTLLSRVVFRGDRSAVGRISCAIDLAVTNKDILTRLEGNFIYNLRLEPLLKSKTKNPYRGYLY